MSCERGLMPACSPSRASSCARLDVGHQQPDAHGTEARTQLIQHGGHQAGEARGVEPFEADGAGIVLEDAQGGW